MENSIENRLSFIEQSLSDLLQRKNSKEQIELVSTLKKMLEEKLDVFSKDHLDTSEACRYLGISKSTLYN